MREAIIITSQTDSFTIPCPVGKRIRLVTIRGAITGFAAGEQVEVVYSRSQQQIANAVSAPLEAGAVQFGAGVGQTSTGALVAASTAAGFGLPDLWLQFDVTITVAVAAGTASALVAVYERE